MKNLKGLIVYGVGGGYAGIILDKIEKEVKGQTTSITMYLVNRKLSYEFEDTDDNHWTEGWIEVEPFFELIKPSLIKRFFTKEEQDNVGVRKES